MKRPYGELFILELLKHKHYTTKQISNKYNLLSPSVSRILNKLLKEKVVEQYTKNNNERDKYFKLNE